MHGLALKSWKNLQKEPLHLLTHPFYKQVDFLFSFIDKVYLFERDFCQKSIGKTFYNKIAPLEHIEQLLNQLNHENFESIIDLSQSDTSSRWMSFIDAKNKLGVCYDSTRTQRKMASTNPYMIQLHQSPSSPYHFNDLFKKSLGLPLESLPHAQQRWKESPHPSTWQSPSSNEKPIILLQTLSSDVKKNWPPQYWRKLIQLLSEAYPEYQLILLASPSEHLLIENNFGDLSSRLRIQCTTIVETYYLLQKAHLLITLDTAIKHLAVWTQTPIVELALGSSNPQETGAYQNEALILKSTTSCSPCRHSLSCPYPNFPCHETIRPMDVIHAVHLKLERLSIRQLNEINPSILNKIYAVSQNREGWFKLNSINTLTHIHNEAIHAR